MVTQLINGFKHKMAKPLKNKAYTILLHGIWMRGFELSLLQKRLCRRGQLCLRFNYRSLGRTPGENAQALVEFVASLDAERVDFVAHSLGGIVLLHYFSLVSDPLPGRVVMLGTPARGSLVARRMASSGLAGLFLGKSIEQGLLGDAPGWSNKRELGMIAGTSGIGIGYLSGRLPRPNDGTVVADEVDVDGCAERLLMPVSHTGMLFSKAVARRARKFLLDGHF